MKSRGGQGVLRVLQPKNRRGQVTIFIIIAIVIVAAIVTFFVVRNVLDSGGTGGSSDEVFVFFESCIEEKTRNAISAAGSQGGYLEVPDFEPGSEYAPFSNQLDFLGVPVPYWYYVSSNGVIKEQIPSKTTIEREMKNYLDVELESCDFSSLRAKGYDIDVGEVSSDVKIFDNEVRVDVGMDLSYDKVDVNARRTSHEVSVVSEFGEFYDLAREIYDKEKGDMFLEKYTQDVLYNYAPVTGSEISCSPLIWNAQEVSDELKEGISANVQSLRIDDGNSRDEYFVVDVASDKDVRFLYDERWPSRVEIWPAENNLLVAEPIGLEQGLGILGFCYIPYHFVYDIYHPVLIQIYNDDEIFQFPVSVVIDKSVPRESLVVTEPVDFGSLDVLCSNANTGIEVSTFDSSLNPVEARISFECFNEVCSIGSTEISGGDAVLDGSFPQCVNGKVLAKADGFVTGETIVSTNEGGNVNVILDRLYEVDARVVLAGRDVASLSKEPVAVIHFTSDRHSAALVYPEQTSVSLSEGLYEVNAQVFSGSSLTIPSSSRRECVSVPKKGLLGVFGGTSEECFNVEIPSTTLDNALSGGGKNQILILEDDLRVSNRVVIDVPSLPSPLSLDQLQQNYELFELQAVEVRF